MTERVEALWFLGFTRFRSAESESFAPKIDQSPSAAVQPGSAMRQTKSTARIVRRMQPSLDRQKAKVPCILKIGSTAIPTRSSMEILQ
jgi:hypothetical protein